MTTPISAGWQPAPDGNGEQWWNGVDWSESRRGQRTAPVYGPPTPDTGHPASPPAAPSPYAAPSAPPPYAPAPTNQYAPPAVGTPAQSLATAALVLGIVAVVFGFVGAVAVVLGLMARARLKQETAPPKYRSYATTGIVLGAIFFIMSSANMMWLFGSLLLPFGN